MGGHCGRRLKGPGRPWEAPQKALGPSEKVSRKVPERCWDDWSWKGPGKKAVGGKKDLRGPVEG